SRTRCSHMSVLRNRTRGKEKKNPQLSSLMVHNVEWIPFSNRTFALQSLIYLFFTAFTLIDGFSIKGTERFCVRINE
ncbi:hypothetical protein ALC56_05849, partial [Trachymyrmex septentrionalis]